MNDRIEFVFAENPIHRRAVAHVRPIKIEIFARDLPSRTASSWNILIEFGGYYIWNEFY